MTVVKEAPAQLEIPGTEPAPKKVSRDILIALRHMNKRREALIGKRRELNEQIEALDAAILALE